MVHERITLFLFELFGIDWQPAQALHEHYYLRHGATLLGLAVDHIDQIEHFLEFVHDIDRSALKPDPILAREVEGCRGKTHLHERLAKACHPDRSAARPRCAF